MPNRQQGADPLVSLRIADDAIRMCDVPAPGGKEAESIFGAVTENPMAEAQTQNYLNACSRSPQPPADE